MITLAEFDRVQEILGRPGRPKPKKRYFPYTGLMKCDECGLSITAEEKTNKYGYHYLYYRCTHRRRNHICRQPAITEERLEVQIVRFLKTLVVPEELQRLVLTHVSRIRRGAADTVNERVVALDRAIDAIQLELSNLTKMRMLDLVDDAGFFREQRKLRNRELRIKEARRQAKIGASRIEFCQTVISFSNQALELFRRGSPRTKRVIVEITGSNLFLKDRILSIEAAEPFFAPAPSAKFVTMRATVENIRKKCQTVDAEKMEELKRIMKTLLVELEERLQVNYDGRVSSEITSEYPASIVQRI